MVVNSVMERQGVMPKTQINHPRENKVYTGDSDAPTTCETTMDPILNVNWRNSVEGAGHVQLSLDVSLPYVRTALEEPNGLMVIGSTLLFTPVLDRSEINTLIRALRKARDAAYGADA
jgi:hypothetical protein